MILINGQPAASVDALDRGLHYGDGLFETVAFARGAPLLWQRHMSRLKDGCHRLALPTPEAERLYAETVQANGEASRSVVKILITRGVGERGYRPSAQVAPTRLVMTFPWPSYPDSHQRTGIAVRLCQTRLSHNPSLAGIKHLNRLEQVLARAEWNDEAFAEGLMLDASGLLVEGTMSNLFLMEGAKLVTPGLHQCGIAGVMRAQIMDCAAALGTPVLVEPISVARALAADGLFLTNSLIGLWPVRNFEDRRYGVHPLMQKLQQQLRQENACA